MHTTNYIMSTSDQKLYTEFSFCAFDGILLTQDLKAIQIISQKKGSTTKEFPSLHVGEKNY